MDDPRKIFLDDDGNFNIELGRCRSRANHAAKLERIDAEIQEMLESLPEQDFIDLFAASVTMDRAKIPSRLNELCFRYHLERANQRRFEHKLDEIQRGVIPPDD